MVAFHIMDLYTRVVLLDRPIYMVGFVWYLSIYKVCKDVQVCKSLKMRHSVFLNKIYSSRECCSL